VPCCYDLGPATQARIQYRHCSLWSLRRVCQSHRLHRGAGRHRPDPGSSSREGTGCPCPAPPGAPNQGATCHAVSFRRKRTPKPISAKTPLKNPRHGLLRALVQEWTDMNCEITSANNVSGPQADISRISTVQLAVSVRKSTSSRPFICPILFLLN
jgi:hypothetical protein